MLASEWAEVIERVAIFRRVCSESPRVPLPIQVQQLPAWNNFVSDVYTTSQKVPTALSFADSTHPTL